MSLEAAGDVVHGALISKAVADQPSEAHFGVHTVRCADCGAQARGNFCFHCGQSTHAHRTLLHLGEELLHGVFHFDARIWRTLPLLVFNPGRLTREWIQGRRTRFVSPLALFLFTIFILFFAFSLFPASDRPVPVSVRISDARNELAVAKVGVEKAERAVLANASGTASATSQVSSASNGTTDLGAAGVAAGALAAATQTVKIKEGELATLEDEAKAKPRDDGLEPGSWQAGLKDSVASGELKLDTGNQEFDKKIRQKLQNPDLAIYKLQQTAYKFAFLLIPFSIPLLALLFLWKRGFTFYDHGVFVLYSMTYVAIISMVMGMINTYAWAAYTTFPLLFSVPTHMYFQLKGTYALSIGSALWRSVVLLFLSAMAIVIFLVTIIFMGLTG